MYEDRTSSTRKKSRALKLVVSYLHLEVLKQNVNASDDESCLRVRVDGAPRIVEDEVVALSSTERSPVVSCILGERRFEGF